MPKILTPDQLAEQRAENRAWRDAQALPEDHRISTNRVDHPSHYNSGKIEVIEAIEDWKLDFNRGNAVKYIARAGKKQAANMSLKEIEDLEKAIWYLRREVEIIKAVMSNRATCKPDAMDPEWPVQT